MGRSGKRDGAVESQAKETADARRYTPIHPEQRRSSA
jgi:hypothetical protein